MSSLIKAHQELFRRKPDERFSSIEELYRHCQEEKERSIEQWHAPAQVVPECNDETLVLRVNGNGTYGLNSWSFSQLCRQADVSRDTLNKVSADTACRALRETLPVGTKPIQLFTRDEFVRSIHGASYTRLYNADLLQMVRQSATDFTPPQEAVDGGTGLYCGEQDMFCFLIDPTGWAEIEGQAFAPGFFLWNSEVGRRTVGIETFWFQAICQNHIVWDATEIVELSRKHTANVHECLNQIRQTIEALVSKRDERREGFVQVIKRAMQTPLVIDDAESFDMLKSYGISQSLTKEALEIARQKGALTVFSLVDALTRLSKKYVNAGDRTEADERAARVLALAA